MASDPLSTVFETIQTKLKQEGCLMLEELPPEEKPQSFFGSMFGPKKPVYTGVSKGIVIFSLKDLHIGKTYQFQSEPSRTFLLYKQHVGIRHDAQKDQLVIFDSKFKTQKTFDLVDPPKGILGSVSNLFSSKAAKETQSRIEDNLSSEIGKHVGKGISDMAKNEKTQEAWGKSIAENSDNPLIKTLASNKQVQSGMGSIISGIASNTTVQKKIGTVVVNKAKDELSKGLTSFK